MSEVRFVIPEVVASHFHIRPGDKIGDFGAGAGNFVSILSRLTGHQGRVYACEIQKNLVETLEEKIRQGHLGNVEVIWCDIEESEGSKIISDTLDVAIIVNTLFQMEDKQAAVNEISRTLRPGGKFFIIDWSESWSGMGPQPGDVLSEGEARSLAESAGLTFERSFDAGAHHYGLAFRK